MTTIPSDLDFFKSMRFFFGGHTSNTSLAQLDSNICFLICFLKPFAFVCFNFSPLTTDRSSKRFFSNFSARYHFPSFFLVDFEQYFVFRWLFFVSTHLVALFVCGHEVGVSNCFFFAFLFETAWQVFFFLFNNSFINNWLQSANAWRWWHQLDA